jgi:hypothetical protein
MKPFITGVVAFLVVVLFAGCGGTIAALQSNVYSQIGDHHYRNQSYREAFEAYKSSAEKGDAYSFYRLYGMYANGYGVPKNNALADKMLEEAARLGYPAAEVGVANGLIFTLKNQNMKRGLALLESAASKEFVYAYADLYTVYWYGIGVPKNTKKAGEYYRLAVANGFDPRLEVGNVPQVKTATAKELTATIQSGLKKLGFYKGAVDGVTGPMTQRAIKAFQEFHGYAVNTSITPQLERQVAQKAQ